MKVGNYIKVIAYVFIVITLIHIVIGILAPASRSHSGFEFAVLAKAAKADMPDAGAEFPSPVYITDRRTGLPNDLSIYSFAEPQAALTYSDWYDLDLKSGGDFYIMTGGFPFLEGNDLHIEVQSKDGIIKKIDLMDKVNPQKTMAMRKIRAGRDGGLYRIRIAANHAARGVNSWFVVSEPFLITGKSGELMAIVRVILSVIAAVTLLLGPGLALRALFREIRIFRASAFIPLPGMLMSAVCGLMCWKMAPHVNPQSISLAFALIYVFLCIVGMGTKVELVSNMEWKVIGVVFIVILIAAAKGGYSRGPFGELYGGTISRTLDAGGRPDSRIQYHVVQLVGNGLDPYGGVGSRYFYPWSFASRTPLGGLTAAPLVFLSGARPPLDMPSQSWIPFDDEGFAVYRIAMIVLSAASLFGVFGAAAALMGEAAGYVCVVLLSLTPFFVHEVYYSWPKLAAAGLVMTALYAVFVGRQRLAGVFLGLGYLYHPSAIFSLPVVLFVWAAKEAAGSLRAMLNAKFLLDGGIIVVSFVVFPILWTMVNGDTNRQAFFLQYIFMANEKLGAGGAAWVISRLKSLANTLVPLYLYVFSGDIKEVNSLYGRVPGIIPFCFQYSNTVPFGLGLTALVVYLKRIYGGLRRYPLMFSAMFSTMFSAVIVLPFIGFAVYWGYNVTGLMPEGLHVWLLCLIVFTVWVWRPLRISRAPSIILSLRGVEVMIMLIAPVWFSMDVWLDEIYYVNDLVMLFLMFGGTALLVKKTLALGSLFADSS